MSHAWPGTDSREGKESLVILVRISGVHSGEEFAG